MLGSAVVEASLKGSLGIVFAALQTIRLRRRRTSLQTVFKDGPGLGPALLIRAAVLQAYGQNFMRMVLADLRTLSRLASPEAGIQEVVAALSAALFGSAIRYTGLETPSSLLFAAVIAIFAGRRLAMSETILQNFVQPCSTFLFRTAGLSA